MKTTINIILVCALALLTMRCEVVSENLLQSPNSPAPEDVSSDFLLNNILLSTPTMFGVLGGDGAAVTRMTHMFGNTYGSAFQAQSFDTDWSVSYATILKDVEQLIPRANERRFFSHAGMARVIRAYTLVNLVDKFGDVPLDEALDETNFNPNVNTGPEVYAAALADLDSAITALQKDEVRLPETDVFYGDLDDDERDMAWIRLANTIKLKILFQQRLINGQENAAEINALLAGTAMPDDDDDSDDGDDSDGENGMMEADIIDEAGEEWIFRYSTNSTNPESRHPNYSANYTGTGAAGGAYMANYYMNLMWNGKENPDPRIRYYFYRQTDAPTEDVNEQQCINNPPPSHYAGNSGNGVDGNDPFCEDWNDVGYWGRDHGNSLGIPPDNLLRTTYGVYPAGGNFDADQAAGVAVGDGLAGAGIRPMWMPFYTDFVRAEVEQTINGNDALAQAALEEAIRGSIQYVADFGSGNNPIGTNLVPEDFETTEADIDAYVSEVLTEYNAADSDNKLNIIGREFYLALWGNGIEAYNLYRRIAPDVDAAGWDLQPHLNPNPGVFYLSFTYPAAFVERNSSVGQKESNDVPVFWFGDNDTGFANF